MSRCQFIKADKEQCQANAMTDSQFCFSHNPEVADERRDAVKRGGEPPRKVYEPLTVVRVENTKDVVSLLAITIGEVRAGSIELRVANCIAYLSGHLIKAFEVAGLEERIKRLEQIVSER